MVNKEDRGKQKPLLSPNTISSEQSTLKKDRRKLRNTHQELEIYSSTNRGNKTSCATSVERKDTGSQIVVNENRRNKKQEKAHTARKTFWRTVNLSMNS